MSTKKIVSIGLALCILSAFIISILFDRGEAGRIGDRPISKASYFAYWLSPDRAQQYHNMIMQESTIGYAESNLGVELPEGMEMAKFRAIGKAINKKKNPGQDLVNEELDRYALSEMAKEQLMVPIKEVPLLSDYDKKIAETIARKVGGFYLSVGKAPQGYKSSAEYVSKVKEIFKSLPESERVDFFKREGFTSFKDLAHYNLFWGNECPKCEEKSRCRECLTKVKKVEADFEHSNPLGLKSFEGAAILLAKKGELISVKDPGDKKSEVMIFISEAELNKKIYKFIVQEARATHEEELMDEFTLSMYSKNRRMTISAPPTLFVIIIGLFIFLLT